MDREEEAILLFMAIEGRLRANGRPNAAPKRIQGMRMKGCKDLKHLVFSVNYDN